jgi:hypothetical protein
MRRAPQLGMQYAIWVSGNWRMTFEFDNGDAYVVDYEDYHLWLKLLYTRAGSSSATI